MLFLRSLGKDRGKRKLHKKRKESGLFHSVQRVNVGGRRGVLLDGERGTD